MIISLSPLCFVYVNSNETTFPSRPSPDREALRAELISSGVLGADAYVVVAGPANVYGHYVTTREEYGIQRYEGASTIFGQCECFLRQAVLCFAKCFILLENVTTLWCIWGFFLWFYLNMPFVPFDGCPQTGISTIFVQ